VLITSWGVAHVYRPAITDGTWNWTPSVADQAKRAIRLFVRKNPQYALTGGNARKRLILYELGDTLSATWARLHVDERGSFVSFSGSRTPTRDRQGACAYRSPSSTATRMAIRLPAECGKAHYASESVKLKEG
jgi:hypothetical protein